MLAATVGNLTQDIVAKDKKVRFLEYRIRALESLQAQEVVQANGVPSSIVVSDLGAEKSKLWWLLSLSILALLVLLFRDWIRVRYQPKQFIDDQFGYDAAKPNSRFERTELSANECDYSVLSSRHVEPNKAATVRLKASP
ncbi:MAG: hypothetical protein ACI9XU_001184 [Arenicella sp.]